MPQGNSIAPIEAAIDYAKRGWPVFPVHTPNNGRCSCRNPQCGNNVGKHPRGNFAPNGLHDATTDPATIREWWQAEPDANIGIRTGAVSGLVVLDIDPAKGGDESLTDFERRFGSLPPTVEALTGGGGRHILFSHPGTGLAIPNSVAGLAPGLDIRADGGYVVAPPSLHKSGRQYAWEVTACPEDVSLVPLPAWLLDLIKKPKDIGHTATERFDTAKALEGVPEGQRDDSIFRLACKLRHADVPQDITERLLLEAAANCSPPFPEANAREKVRNAYTRYEPGRWKQENGSVSTVADPWPILNEDAFYGVAGNVVRLLQPHTEADPVALLASFLSEIGTMLGRKPHLILDGTYHPLLFWPVLVGRSSKSRKGSAGHRMRTLCAQADQSWTRGEYKGTLSSGEGLAYAVRDAMHRDEPLKDRGRPTGETVRTCVDLGVEDKRLFLVQAEFGVVLRIMGRDGNSLSGVMRDAWDGLDLSPMTKANRVRATEPHIGIVGHVTRDELLRNLTDTEASNGFGNRFVWLLVRRYQELPFSSSPDGTEMVELVRIIGGTIQSGQDINTIILLA